MCVIMNTEQVVGQKVHAFTGYIRLLSFVQLVFLMKCPIKVSDTQSSTLTNSDDEQVAWHEETTQSLSLSVYIQYIYRERFALSLVFPICIFPEP